MYVSCEYLGTMIEIDLQQQRVIHTLDLQPKPASPQDVKLSPDGMVLYVADQDRGGLWEIDPQSFTVLGFLPTGKGAHGLYPSRDARRLYVSNRIAGTISVVDFATRRIVKTWNLGSSSPDMGGVSADGKTLWLSGRYNAEVYVINTQTGRLRARIPVGQGPHGLCVWPQPGRYSLGHTGILR
jgi:YVTN family beta-propeller protein